jgi:hypothetical protein
MKSMKYMIFHLTPRTCVLIDFEGMNKVLKARWIFMYFMYFTDQGTARFITCQELTVPFRRI